MWLLRTLLFILVFCMVSNSLPAQDSPPEAWSTIAQRVQGLLGQQQFAQVEEELVSASEVHGEQVALWYFLGYTRHAQKEYDSAMQAYERANELSSGQGASILYNMACIWALRGESDKAFAKLDAAVQAGFSNFSQLQSDPDLQSLKSDERFSKYQVRWLSDEELFTEPTRILHKWSGESAGDQFGWTARRVGDVDMDGAIDFIATAPTFNQGAGKIYLYSSRSGKLIHEVQGEAGYRLGNSAVGLGDVNQDGVVDFVAGAPKANGKGAVFVYSGKDATLIHRIDGETSGGQFGYEVSELGDYDADGVADFLVGEMAGNGKEPGAGRVILYSGVDAQPLFNLLGEQAGDGFGNAAASVEMESGTHLLAVGAQNAGPNDRGRVYVYQIEAATPELKFTVEGDENSVNLGQMFLSFPGDLNRDGVPDLYVSDFSDNSRVQGGGKVRIVSGVDGKELLSLQGAQAGEGLGTSPSDAGDVDGDGIGDLVIGAWQNREGAGSGGKVYLYSAAGQGRLLRSWTSRQAGDTLGFDACGIGDVDGDGHVDFLLTAAWSNKHGPKTGRVFIVAGEDYTSRQPAAANRSPSEVHAGKVSTILDELEAGTGGLCVDEQGNLYSADFGGRLDGKGAGGHRLYKITPNGDAEVFSQDLRGGSGNNFGPDGCLYQSSIGGNFISKISADGIAEKYCEQGLQNPVGLVFNSSGELFVCNCGSNSIQRVSQDSKSSVFCKSSLLKCPNGIACGPDDMLYVCNFGNGDVIQIDSSGNASKLATLPGQNNGHLIYYRGFLYVIARKDCRIYQVDLAGRTRVFAGSGMRGSEDGDPFTSTFSLPNSLCISPDGQAMYVNETAPTEGDQRILSPTRIRRIELKNASGS